MPNIETLLSIMAQLRDPDSGCPWDVKQDFDSIAPYTIEEAFEVAEAIAQRDYPELKEELGDLLLQVVFHSQIAREQGLFDFNDVVQVLCDKMVRRHPHVFGESDAADEQAVHRISRRVLKLLGERVQDYVTAPVSLKDVYYLMREEG